MCVLWRETLREKDFVLTPVSAMQLSEVSEEQEVETGSEPPANEDSSSIKLLILFQRLLLCIIYSHVPSSSVDSGTEPQEGVCVCAFSV